MFFQNTEFFPPPAVGCAVAFSLILIAFVLLKSKQWQSQKNK